ncbi:AraC family transcriptional regulator [Microbacteriaceae bacterium VKM Ac-2855]|nr:AraC family transcriptional regulator [Microbacteriaceae bacterium VKM Ac-2855]
MDEERGTTTRSEIAGSDVDEARQMFEGEYNGDDFAVEPTDAAFSYRYTSAGDDELTLRGTLFAGSIKGSIRTEGEYVVSWITAGEGATDLEVDSVRLDIGQPSMFVNNRPAVFDFHDFRQNLMHFDGRYLEQVAGDHEGADGPLLFDATARPGAEALRIWALTVASVARTVFDGTSSALARSEANRTAAVALLNTFPHTWLNAPAELSIPATGKLRTAIEFIHANAHLPIRSETIAEAGGMSLRSLQNGFRRQLGLSPVDYLRRVRLDRVQEELRRGDAGTVAVGEVAGRWGFAHLGRFSASYAARFGEYPRTTLQN